MVGCMLWLFMAGWLGSYVAMRLTGMCVVGLDVWLWLFVWLVV